MSTSPPAMYMVTLFPISADVEPYIYCVKGKAGEQLLKYIKRLEQEGLAMKSDDQDLPDITEDWWKA